MTAETTHLEEKISFCRICMGHCGVVVSVDDQQRLVDIRGDHDDPQTMGYACFKGLKATESHNSPERILKPLKRQKDGSFTAIPLSQALDEIAEKIDGIRSVHGAEAIAGYKGGGGFFTSSAVMMLNSFLQSIGSPKAFSSVTIDQSAKAVAAGRIGIWPAGRDPFSRGDVFMIFGGNPLLSLTTNGFDIRNPLKRLKEAKAWGMKLIVIDPRRTETAKFADVFLQPLPGEDCTLLAGLLHIVLSEGWQDQAFCQQYAADLDLLEQAVASFTPAYVAQRAGVEEAQLWQAAEVFARDSQRGAASSATGPDMSSHSNLAEHLIECLNVVCGRFIREGEEVPNPGALLPRWPRLAEVMPAPRWWEEGYQSRLGDYGLIDGELPSGILADEILQPGEGQVRCLLVHGGNPASAIPDQRKIVKALESLELLVTIEPFMSQTAHLSDYILPPLMQYEREDLPLFIYEFLLTPVPYTRYTKPVAKPPEDSELVDDAQFFHSLAKRLGVTLDYFGEPLSNDRNYSQDDLLALAARFAPIAFDELKSRERGVLLDKEPQVVEAGSSDARFSLFPDDVANELGDVIEQGKAISSRPYRMAVRRLRDASNSASINLPAIKKRLPTNFAYMNPEDMKAEGLSSGDDIELNSDHGSIIVRTKEDSTLRPGVVSISHGFGMLPDRSPDHMRYGASTNLLISTDRDCESINAMPRMSGVPLSIKRCENK